MSILKKFTFEAAHKLEGLPKGHKCARLHGHSYTVEIHVEGPLDSQIGWVMDFSEIKVKFKPVLERLDHHYLNDIDDLGNPTSENLARWIWKKLEPELPNLSKVVIKETCTTGCIYRGP